MSGDCIHTAVAPQIILIAYFYKVNSLVFRSMVSPEKSFIAIICQALYVEENRVCVIFPGSLAAVSEPVINLFWRSHGSEVSYMCTYGNESSWCGDCVWYRRRH